MIDPKRALHDNTVASGDYPVQKLLLGGESTEWKDTVSKSERFNGIIPGDPLTAYVSENQHPSKNVEPRAQFRVGDTMPLSSSKHCSFADGVNDCWSVRVHPVINELKSSEGFTTGG